MSGRPCTAKAATAICYSELQPFLQWNTSEIDRVLLVLAGNAYFIQCLSHEPQYLNKEELLSSMCIADTELNLDIQPHVVIGIVNAGLPLIY